ANDIESVRIKEIQHQNDMTRIGTAALWKATAAPRRRYFNSLLAKSQGCAEAVDFLDDQWADMKVILGKRWRRAGFI
ncbi:hypothetical protein C0Z18_31145, partial [Trinickia dabaoshanensis]